MTVLQKTALFQNKGFILMEDLLKARFYKVFNQNQTYHLKEIFLWFLRFLCDINLSN